MDSRFEIRDSKLKRNLESRISNLESIMSISLCWLTQTAADVPDKDEWLSEGERGLLAGMRFPKRRGEWRLGRWTGKQAILAFLLKEGLVLPSLEIRAAADGAPEAFLDGCPRNVSISISHSGDRGFCVVGPPDFPVGCDLEMVEPREEPFVADYFTPEERSFTEQLRSAEQTLAVNLIWSAKETALKILREGLRRDTRSVLVQADFRVEEGLWSTWTARCLDSSRVFHGWWRSGEGFVYTLASDRQSSAPDRLLM